jgi:hypothetical protein
MESNEPLLQDIVQLQRQLDALLDCKYAFIDNPIILQSFKLLGLDLKLLFHVLNEAIIPLLERFFEMKNQDAQKALEIYKKFVIQTEKTVEFFNVAKKVRDLNMEVPALKAPPESLAKTLEKYIKDPNFEHNRQAHIAKRKATPRARSPPRSAPQEPAWTTDWENDAYKDVGVIKTDVARTQPQEVDFFGSLEEEFAQPYPSYSQPQQIVSQQSIYSQAAQTRYSQPATRTIQNTLYSQASPPKQTQSKPGQMQPFSQLFHASAGDDDWAQFDKAFPSTGFDSSYKHSSPHAFQQSYQQTSPSFQTSPSQTSHHTSPSFQPSVQTYQSPQYSNQQNQQTQPNPYVSGGFGASTNPFASDPRPNATNPFAQDSLDIFDPLK